MKSSDALDSHNVAGYQAVDACRNGIIGGQVVAFEVRQPNSGTAVPAGVRLGVKTAVQRVIVLRLAGATHGKCGHRSLRTVVGNAARDRETGAAVGAIEKWVTVAPIV